MERFHINLLIIARRLATNGMTWPGMTRVSEPFSALIKTSPGENRDPFKTGKAVVALDAIAKGCGLRLTPFARGNHRPSLPGLITTQIYIYICTCISKFWNSHDFCHLSNQVCQRFAPCGILQRKQVRHAGRRFLLRHLRHDVPHFARRPTT